MALETADVAAGGAAERRAEDVEEGLGRRARFCRRRPPASRRRGLPAAYALLAVALTGRALAAGPTLQPVPDVVIKACGSPLEATMTCSAASSCQDGEAHMMLGHSDPTLLNSLVVTIQRLDPALGTQASPLRDAVVRKVSGQTVIIVCPKGKASGRTTVSVRVTDSQGQSIPTDFTVVVQSLTPVFDDAGPSRTVVDIRTIMGTPTYPYVFLVGHEDPDKVDTLRITAFSMEPLVIPNECCTETASYLKNGGISLSMEPYQPTGDLAFVVGQLKAKARRVTIVIRPAAEKHGNVELSLRLTDGNNTKLSTITVFVNNRPQLDKFCAYDVLALDNLITIADMYGMHWMTLFMMNNHTLTHPDNLTPGTRLSIGRPYIVKKGDSLYSIATRYGTTWQHLHKLNPSLVPDEKNLFAGQLLCLAPDLAFITCRHGNLP